jgi:hypothetical protein
MMTARGFTGRTLALLLLAGCGEPAQQPVDRTAPEAEAAPAEGVPGAVYHTGLTFVSFRIEPLLLHLRLNNRTGPATLRLDYRGWMSTGEGWGDVLARRDSLPVPRAAWRVVPTGPLRVRVGDGAELAALLIELPDGRLRIATGGEIAAWTSATGQREALRLAEVRDAGGAEAGLLLERQRARLASDLPPAAISQSFLVADTLGNGLLLMRDRAEPDAQATAWTWLEGLDSEWPDPVILTLTAPAGSSGRWSLELPGAGIFCELEATGEELDELSELAEEGPGVRIFRVAGTLVMGGERRPVAGVGVEERGP